MTKIGKKEQLILNRIARKRLSLVDEPTNEEIQAIKEKKIELNTIPMGQPQKYTSPKEMKVIMDAYIVEQNEKKLPCTLGGLALRLGMSVESIRNYEKKDNYFEIIRYYRDTILAGMEERLFTDPKLFNSVRYYLNNNFSRIYSDKVTVDTNITGSVSLVELNRLARESYVEGELVEETVQEIPLQEETLGEEDTLQEEDNR